MGETTDEVVSVDNSRSSGTHGVSGGSLAKSHEAASDSSQEASEIRSGIEQTRSNLSTTIDALQDKLDPTRIAEQVKEQIREKATEAFDTAKSAVKEATIGKAEKIMSSVSDAVTDMTGRTGAVVSETSSSVVQYIRDNPLSFALVGVGLGLLAMNRRRPEPTVDSSGTGANPSLANQARDAMGGVADSARGVATTVAENARAAAERTATAVSAATSTVKTAAGTAVDTTRQQFHDVTHRTRQGAQIAGDRFKETLQDNPIALGVAALAAGALVGLTFPTTRAEGEYMGEARDKLVGQAKSVAQDVVGKVQRVTEEAGETVKNVAQKEGLVSS